MKENERWAGLIMFLTMISAVATALLAALAVLFADPDKIVGNVSKTLVVIGALLVVATLIVSLLASAMLSNYLVRFDYVSPAVRRSLSNRVTVFAGITFWLFGFSAAALFAYFVWTTCWQPAPAKPVAVQGACAGVESK